MGQHCDLGTNTGTSRYEIDDSFREAPLRNTEKCIVCGQPADYRLIAKKIELNSQAVYSQGLVCEYHLNTYDPKDYGIRKIRG